MTTRPALARSSLRRPAGPRLPRADATLGVVAMLSLLLTSWFGTLAALGFLGATLGLAARHPIRAINDTLRSWPIFLIPLWCLLTWFWSDEPSATLRFGIQLFLTVFCAVLLAWRLPPSSFVRAAFLAFAVAAVASLLFGSVRADGGGWLGIFRSKNAFSLAMSAFVLLSTSLALDPRIGGRWRAMGIAGAGVGAVLLVLAQSAGGLFSTAAAVLLGLGLVALARFEPGARLAVVAAVLLGTGAVGLVALSFRAELAAAFLDVTGKDVTLTGRTELWSAAMGEIRDRPLLGHGFEAVWIEGNPVAEMLWARFGIESRGGFNFHNTWIHSAVEIGLLGTALLIAVFGATLVLVARWVLAARSAGSLFFAMFMAKQGITSLFEVVAYQHFQVATLLTVAATVYGLRVRQALRGRSAPLRPPAGAGRGSGSRPAAKQASQVRSHRPARPA